ncbi:MAG: hypothetical protein B7L53_00975 [Thermofilum sp. NZ13]|nr:MAG: hypothetical protein B7L53_00975 [Thermofilum sp. NZ13]
MRSSLLNGNRGLPVSRAELREQLLRLLREDEEFRYTVAGILGYLDVLKRLEEHDRKFNEILSEIRQLREEQVKLREDFNRVDKVLAELLKGQERLWSEFNRLNARVEVTIGSMGRRWGEDLERMVLEIFREALEKRGIELGKVRKLRLRDEDGSLTGVKGRIVDVDVLVEDEKVYVIEVKSRAELEHVEALPLKSEVVGKVLGKQVARTILVAVNVDREAYERAGELGIEVVCGHVID